MTDAVQHRVGAGEDRLIEDPHVCAADERAAGCGCCGESRRVEVDSGEQAVYSSWPTLDLDAIPAATEPRF
jgi:hypothetical protein